MINPIFTDAWETLSQIQARTQIQRGMIKRARRLARAAKLVAVRLTGGGEVKQYRRLCR